MEKSIIGELVSASKPGDLRSAIKEFEKLMADAPCTEHELARAVTVIRAAFRAYVGRTGEEVCTFCGSRERDVERLLTAGDSAICDSCIWNAAREIGLTRGES